MSFLSVSFNLELKRPFGRPSITPAALFASSASFVRCDIKFLSISAANPNANANTFDCIPVSNLKLSLIVHTFTPVFTQIIINGTGRYTYHGSIADCGITGRKLACDFYSTACPIGGGSPWTKDASKADLTLNVYARILACENLADNDECFVYLSSCIGRNELPSGLIKTIKNGIVSYHDLWCNQKPSTLIKAYGLDKPIYAKLCDKSISGILPNAE